MRKMQPRDSSIRTVVPYMMSLFAEITASLGDAANWRISVSQSRFWERIASPISSFLLSLLCEDMCSAISSLWLPMPFIPHYYEPLSAPQFWRAESWGVFSKFLCKCRPLSVLLPHWRSSSLRTSTDWFFDKTGQWLAQNKYSHPFKKKKIPDTEHFPYQASNMC